MEVYMKNRETYLLKCKIKNGGFDISKEIEIVETPKTETIEVKPIEEVEEKIPEEEIVNEEEEEEEEEKPSFTLK